jgi:hypothetical protein
MAASFPSKVQSLKDLDKQTFDFIIVGGKPPESPKKGKTRTRIYQEERRDVS